MTKEQKEQHAMRITAILPADLAKALAILEIARQTITEYAAGDSALMDWGAARPH